MKLSHGETTILAAMIEAGGVGLIWPTSDGGIDLSGSTARNLSIVANVAIVDQMLERELIEGHAPYFLVTDIGREAWRNSLAAFPLWRRLLGKLKEAKP